MRVFKNRDINICPLKYGLQSGKYTKLPMADLERTRVSTAQDTQATEHPMKDFVRKRFVPVSPKRFLGKKKEKKFPFRRIEKSGVAKLFLNLFPFRRIQ